MQMCKISFGNISIWLGFIYFILLSHWFHIIYGLSNFWGEYSICHIFQICYHIIKTMQIFVIQSHLQSMHMNKIRMKDWYVWLWWPKDAIVE
jgi:hypothetical protein